MKDKELENVLIEVKKARADIMGAHTEILKLVDIVQTSLIEQRMTMQYLMTNTDLAEAKIDFGTALIGNQLGMTLFDKDTVAKIKDYVDYVAGDKKMVIGMMEEIDKDADKENK